MNPFVITRRVDFKFTRLIDSQNCFHDKIYIGEAKTMARNDGLDLVCFNLPKGNKPALCKIIDYGKWKYSNDKKKKKDQKVNKHVVKEIRFSPVISDHDVEHKIKQIKEFLEDGSEVMIAMRFKGIQKRLFQEGENIINSIINSLKNLGEENFRKKSNHMILVRLRPVKK